MEADGKDEEAAVTEIEKYLKTSNYQSVCLEIDNGNQAGLAWFSFFICIYDKLLLE